MGKGRGSQSRRTKNTITQFQEYLLGKELSENTIKSYVTSLEQYFLEHTTITKKDGLDWKRELQERGLSAKTVNIRLNAFNTFCDMQECPDCKCKTLRVHQATTISNVISKEDYEKLLGCLKQDKNMKWYFGIKLLATTGARVSEFVRLRKSDFDRGYAELWTKGKIRRIYIPEHFREEATEYYSDLDGTCFLIENRYGGQITTRGVSQSLLNFAERYGIDKKVMHPHSFRHMFAVEFLKQNNNLSLLADVMGHSSVSTTAIYTRLTKEQQISAVNSAVTW